jgi:hypothetical protein
LDSFPLAVAISASCLSGSVVIQVPSWLPEQGGKLDPVLRQLLPGFGVGNRRHGVGDIP